MKKEIKKQNELLITKCKRQVKQDNKGGHRIPRAKPRAAAVGVGRKV